MPEIVLPAHSMNPPWIALPRVSLPVYMRQCHLAQQGCAKAGLNLENCEQAKGQEEKLAESTPKNLILIICIQSL
jgi:hypothetical protein